MRLGHGPVARSVSGNFKTARQLRREMPDSPNVVRTRENRYAVGAAVWAFVFAGISFYWASGGTFGVWTVGRQITSLAESTPGFPAVLWVDAIVKTLLGVLALAIAFPSWQAALPGGRWLPSVAWVAGLAMAAYGSVELAVTGVSALLMVAGILPVTSSVDWMGILGHLGLWDPYWILGGVLFLRVGKISGTQLPKRVACWLNRA